VSQVLSFNENQIDDLPNELYKLEQLRLFGMDDNPLSDIPPHIVEGGSQEVFNYLGERLAKSGLSERTTRVTYLFYINKLMRLQRRRHRKYQSTRSQEESGSEKGQVTIRRLF